MLGQRLIQWNKAGICIDLVFLTLNIYDTIQRYSVKRKRSTPHAWFVHPLRLPGGQGWGNSRIQEVIFQEGHVLRSRGANFWLNMKHSHFWRKSPLSTPVSQAKSSLLAHSSKKRFLRLDPKPKQSQCEHVSIAMDSVSLSEGLSLRNGYVHSTRISKNQQIWKQPKRLMLSDDWNNRNFFSTPICYSIMSHSGHHNLIGPMPEGENTKKQTWKQNCESQQFSAPI